MKTVEALELCSNPSVKKHSFPMIHFTSWRTSHVRVEPGKWLNTSFPYSNGCQIINLDCSSMIFLLVSPLPHLQYHKASAMRTSPNFLQLLAFVSFNDSFTLSLYIYCTTCLVCSIRFELYHYFDFIFIFNTKECSPLHTSKWAAKKFGFVPFMGACLVRNVT